MSFSECNTVAIIGLGLLGGSLGLALKDRGFGGERIGWARRQETTDLAIAGGAIDRTGTLPEVLAAADLTVLCLPIPAIVEFMKKYANCFKKGSVVTDIGSVKRPMAEAASAIRAAGSVFVGSHPMAGTEHSGYENAFAGLYKNADTFIVTDGATDDAVKTVAGFWEFLGTRIRFIGAEHHDMVVAYTSHISHLAALSLVLASLDCPDDIRNLRYAGCATGFRDTSRIASSNPAMWREICEANADVIIKACDEYCERFKEIAESLRKGDFDAFQTLFARGRDLRGLWLDYKAQGERGNNGF